MTATVRITAQTTGVVPAGRVFRDVTLDIDPARTDHTFGADMTPPQSRVSVETYTIGVGTRFEPLLVVTDSIQVVTP